MAELNESAILDHSWVADGMPEPPTNARIVYANGVEVPCPVKYLGFKAFTKGESRKYYGWRVLNEGPFDGREGDTFTYDSGTTPMYIEVPGTGPHV